MNTDYYFRTQIVYALIDFTDSNHKYTDYPLFGVMYAHAHAYQATFSSSLRPAIEAIYTNPISTTPAII